MVLHRDERVRLSPHTAQERTCAGADEDFNEPRGGIPEREIAAMEEER